MKGSDKSRGSKLREVSSTGKARPWKKRKQEADRLAGSYRRLREWRKYERVSECGGRLMFLECSEQPDQHPKRLLKAHFCHVRLCTMCGWRKSQLVAQQVRLVCHEAVQREPTLRFILLTLTVRNVGEKELGAELDHLFDAWDRFSRRKLFRGVVVGWFRALEVTYSWERHDYHPHLHVLLAVCGSYFVGRCYVKQAKWQELWKEAGRLEYEPSVDVRVVKAKKEQTIGGASGEVAKYVVKPEAYLKGPKAERDEVVRVLDVGLKGRRLRSYGGRLREIWKELKERGEVEDEENSDRIEVVEVPENCKCSVCQSDMLEHWYRWSRQEGEYLG